MLCKRQLFASSSHFMFPQHKHGRQTTNQNHNFDGVHSQPQVFASEKPEKPQITILIIMVTTHRCSPLISLSNLEAERQELLTWYFTIGTTISSQMFRKDKYMTIGQVLKSKLTTSKWGDQHLFFR